MNLSKLGLIGGISSIASKLRFPWLFLLFVVVFLANLIIPDPLPLIDELLLGLGALLLSRLRKPANTTTKKQTPS